MRCYEAKAIGVRVRGHRDVLALPPRVVESVIDPAVDQWVSDHRPSYTVPVMPMMSMVDRLASAALDHVRAAYPRQEGTPEWVVTGGTELRAQGWLICDRPKRLRTEVRVASIARRAPHRGGRGPREPLRAHRRRGPKRVASGRIRLARELRESRRPRGRRSKTACRRRAPTSRARSTGARSCRCFGSFSLQPSRRCPPQLDAAGADAPIGAIHHILLDGALHGIPHDELERWSDKISPGHMGVPVRLTAQFFGPPPTQGIVPLPRSASPGSTARTRSPRTSSR